MRRLPALVAALLLPAAQPALLGPAIFAGSLLVAQSPAKAQATEAVGKVAQSFTVRIQGATKGSGVLVKRDGNCYTVLTSWNVVRGVGPGEELDVYTSDGKKYQVEPESIQRIGDVDMAVLTFSSSISYPVARIGDVKSVRNGDRVLLAGFPSGGNNKFKFDAVKLIANASAANEQGYQLIYENNRNAGMGGGVVLKIDGALIGIHGRGELDEEKSILFDTIIKTIQNNFNL